MAYSDVVTGLAQVFRGVTGLAAVLEYDPKHVQDLPLLFLTLDNFERRKSGQVTVYVYRITARLLLRWQDMEQAEGELAEYVNTIPDALEADPQLGGTLSRGYAQVTAGDAGYAPAEQPIYRVCDFTIEVIEK